MLQVISRSQGELEPVFATMLEKAVRMWGRHLEIYTAGTAKLCTSWPHITRLPPSPKNESAPPIVPTQNLRSAAWWRPKTPMHVRDVMAEDAYLARRDSGAVAAVELGGARTVLSVPLLDKGEMTGAFFLCRQHVQSFTDKQIKLGSELINFFALTMRS